ncbi:MAG: hypothetical protein SOZ58_03320 [Prevotella sp.]|nr:hypothetical protein [Prevotella sp.]
MVSLSDILSNDSVEMLNITPGTVLLGEIEGVDHLLSRQVQIMNKNYRFLTHDSYVNCAQPIKGISDYFKGFKRVGQLTDDDLQLVRKEIILSGTLTTKEVDLYNLH